MSTKELEFATLSGNGNLEISQYAGIIGNPVKGNNGKYTGGFNINCNDYVINDYPDFPASHQFYRATDICPVSPQTVLYAPCELRCIYHGTFTGVNDLNETVSTGTCIMTAFETVNKIYCADGVARDLTFILFHGGDKFTGEVGDIFAKNSILYYEGSQGMEEEADHIHVDILKYKCSIKNSEGKIVLNTSEFAEKCKMYYQGGVGAVQKNVFAIKPNESLNFHEVFFGDNISIQDYLTVDDVWESDECFKFSSVMKSEDEIPTHGLVDLGVATYFYNAGSIIYGWVQRLNGDWYFLDYSTGIMKKGWVADGPTWYFLDYTTGIMRTGWVADGSSWYYLDPNSGAMQTGLIELPDGIYYLHPTSGAMQYGWQAVNGNRYYFTSTGAAATGYTRIDGIMYHFNENGVLIS